MTRTEIEKQHWDVLALDPEVDEKYICNIPTDDCLKDLSLDGTVLEIGCGVGRLLPDGGYGIDVSSNMLKIARQRRPECYFKLTTGGIPYPDGFFDVIYSYLVFQHLKPKSIKNYMIEAYRCLDDGGEFRFQFIEGTEREPFSNHYTTDEMSEWMHEAGFETVWFVPSKAYAGWTIMGANK